jgi:tRNA (guanine-N7-)-methyltransferase
MTSDKPHHPLNVNGEPRAFFGRRSGKRLHKGQDQLYADLLPALEIKLPETTLDPAVLFPDQPRRAIEIGYGGGEHLSRVAGENPDTGFIGCEVFSGGIAKLLEAIDERGLGNVRLFTDDALKLLVKLPAASLDAAWLLYPDPWPKTRHHKRRFISPTTLAELARVLKPGAIFRFASDIEDYANWTLAHILREPAFRFLAPQPASWHQPYPGWQPTRYEQKARREGRLVSFYFEFQRR